MNKVIKSSPVNRFYESPIIISPDSIAQEVSEPGPDDIISKTRQQCEIIVNTAHAEVRSLAEKAYAEGYEAGLSIAVQKADSLLEALQQAIDEETAEREALVRSIEQQALMLCVDTAEKVIRHEIRTDKQIVTRVLKMCLRRVKDRNEVTVRVNPAEVEGMRAMRDELLSSAENLRELNIVDDRRISAGGCIVESPSGDFDARIETQIDQIRRKLMDAFSNEFSQSSPEPVEIPADDQTDGHLPD